MCKLLHVRRREDEPAYHPRVRVLDRDGVFGVDFLIDDNRGERRSFLKLDEDFCCQLGVVASLGDGPRRSFVFLLQGVRFFLLGSTVIFHWKKWRITKCSSLSRFLNDSSNALDVLFVVPSSTS